MTWLDGQGLLAFKELRRRCATTSPGGCSRPGGRP
jgi:hypothetical protein